MNEEFSMYWLYKNWGMGKNTPQFPHAQSVGTFAMQTSKTFIEFLDQQLAFEKPDSCVLRCFLVLFFLLNR